MSGKTTRAIDAAIAGSRVDIIFPNPPAMFSAYRRLKKHCKRRGVDIQALTVSMSACVPRASLMPLVGVGVYVDGKLLQNEK